MRDLSLFAKALRGADERLRQEAGPDAVIRVATELSSVFVVRPAADGKQAGTLAMVGKGGGGSVSVVELPRSFQVREITHDGEQFFLTDARGRTAHGTPDQFTAWLKLLDEKDNPRHDEQREEILLSTHLLPDRAVAGLDAPKTNQLVSGSEVDEIIRLGEAWVSVGDEEVWLNFENAWPEKVTELLPHARELLASLDRLGRAGAEHLWSLPSDESKDDSEGESTDQLAESTGRLGAPTNQLGEPTNQLDEPTNQLDDEPDDGSGTESDDESDALGEELEDGEPEDEEAEFFALMAPTSLCVYLTGDFEIHYEGASGSEFYMDGYWPVVRFRADGTPVDWYVDA